MAIFDFETFGRKPSRFAQARRFVMNTSQAAGVIWEFRWGDTTVAGSQCLVERVTLKGNQIANATAEELRFNLSIARTFTAADGTNTASILRATPLQQLSTHAPASLLTDFRESSSATAATGGTKTVDTDPIAIGSFVSLATASTSIGGPAFPIFDWSPEGYNQFPLLLKQNEGWVINLEATKGATQGVVLYLETQWVELLPKIKVTS